MRCLCSLSSTLSTSCCKLFFFFRYTLTVPFLDFSIWFVFGSYRFGKCRVLNFLLTFLEFCNQMAAQLNDSCRKNKIKFIIQNPFDHENVSLGCFGDCKISILTKDPSDDLFRSSYRPKTYANLLFQFHVGSSSIFLGSHCMSLLL